MKNMSKLFLLGCTLLMPSLQAIGIEKTFFDGNVTFENRILVKGKTFLRNNTFVGRESDPKNLTVRGQTFLEGNVQIGECPGEGCSSNSSSSSSSSSSSAPALADLTVCGNVTVKGTTTVTQDPTDDCKAHLFGSVPFNPHTNLLCLTFCDPDDSHGAWVNINFCGDCSSENCPEGNPGPHTPTTFQNYFFPIFIHPNDPSLCNATDSFTTNENNGQFFTADACTLRFIFTKDNDNNMCIGIVDAFNNSEDFYNYDVSECYNQGYLFYDITSCNLEDVTVTGTDNQQDIIIM